MFEGYEFAVCLTHDVDRVAKTAQAPYFALRDRDPRHLLDLLPDRNPYWQFDEVMALEEGYGVRSSFNVLNEPPLIEKPLRSWVNPGDWIQELGRYDVHTPEIVETIRELEIGGWEIGLHGSTHSWRSADQLRRELSVLDAITENSIIGGRQHYLNLDVPETWRRHASIGLQYDTSLGSATTHGFQHGYDPIRPFDDEFVVFPLTLMEAALPDPATNHEEASQVISDLLLEARENEAVMTVLWHPRLFCESDFPGYASLYRDLIEQALAMGAWVGPPAECYRRLDLERDCASVDLEGKKGLTKPTAAPN